MGEVGERPAAGRAAGLELRRGDQDGGDEAGGSSSPAMVSAATEGACGTGDAGREPPLGRACPSADLGMTSTPVSKPDRPSASFGKLASATATTTAFSSR